MIHILINRNFVYCSTQSHIEFCVLWYAESHSVIRLINSLLQNLLHKVVSDFVYCCMQNLFFIGFTAKPTGAQSHIRV